MRSSAEPSAPRAPRLWRDLAALAGGQLASKLCGFLAFAYLARTLAAAGYGAVEYAAGLAFIAAMFVDAGTGPIGVRRVAREPGRRAEIAAEILAVRLLLAVSAAGLLAVSARALAPDPSTARLLALFAVSLLALPWTPMWLFQAVDHVAWAAALQALRNAVFLAAVVLWVDGAGAMLWVGVAEIFGLVVSGVVAVALQRRRVAPLRLRFASGPLRRLLAESLPLGGAELVVVLTAFAPLLLTVHLLGTEAAAAFAGAHRLYFALLTFSWIYHFNFFPVVARAEAAGHGLRDVVEPSFRVVAWGGALGALLLTLLARPLLETVFGAPFGAAAVALALLAWSLPVKALADHAAWALVASGAERAVLACRLAALALLVALGVPLVRRWGADGAAAALLAASVALWTTLHLVARRQLGWMPWAPAAAAATVALALLAGLRALGLPPLAAAGAGALAFGLAAAPLARRLADDLRRLAGAKARATEALQR